MTAAALPSAGAARPLPPAGRVGFWLFLGTEAMLFLALLSAYVVARQSAGANWPQPGQTLADGARLMNPWLGGANTVLLVAANVLVAAASRATARGDNRGARNALAGALALGTLFLGVKLWEYSGKVHHGLLPLTAGEHLPPVGRLWSSYYFGLTGLHALHIVLGLACLLWLLVLAAAGRLAPQRAVLAANLASYWLLVDLVWLALFPLLYLA